MDSPSLFLRDILYIASVPEIWYSTTNSNMTKAKEKSKVIEKHRRHDKDTGSAEVQIAVLSQEIDQLAAHLKKHRKDNHSRKGLLGMVAQRRKLLSYLEREDVKKYKDTIKKIGLKR